jgi:hypothetical protein
MKSSQDNFQPRPFDAPMSLEDAQRPPEAPACPPRETPRFLGDWNQHQGERVRVITTSNLILTGRLNMLAQSYDGSISSVNMDVETIEDLLGRDARRRPTTPIGGRGTMIPGPAVVLIEFAD